MIRDPLRGAKGTASRVEAPPALAFIMHWVTVANYTSHYTFILIYLYILYIVYVCGGRMFVCVCMYYCWVITYVVITLSEQFFVVSRAWVERKISMYSRHTNRYQWSLSVYHSRKLPIELISSFTNIYYLVNIYNFI